MRSVGTGRHRVACTLEDDGRFRLPRELLAGVDGEVVLRGSRVLRNFHPIDDEWLAVAATHSDEREFTLGQ
jgi:hypothetical protein